MSEIAIQDRIDPEFRSLTPHQLWLLEHQMTAFWHGFGLSNGLDVPPEMTEHRRIPSGRKKGEMVEYVRVHPLFMRKVLEEYNDWLRSYQKVWHERSEAGVYPKDFDDFLRSEMAVHWSSRKPIFEMVNLLQDGEEGKKQPAKERHTKESLGKEEKMF